MSISAHHLTRKEFADAIIAQDDDCDYSESGWVAWKSSEGLYCLAAYSHCSCFDTFTALAGGGISDTFESGSIIPDWQGTIDDLRVLVALRGDPRLPGRIANPEDCDYDHLMQVYQQLESYFSSNVRGIIMRLCPLCDEHHESFICPPLTHQYKDAWFGERKAISDFAATLRTLRGKAGLTQLQLEKRALIGINTLSPYERGMLIPGKEVVQCICKALNVPSSKLESLIKRS